METSQDLIPEYIAKLTDKPIIEARFHLVECKTHSAYGDTGYASSKVVTIVMTAAKSGIFGKASPNGRLEMQIANPSAYKVFQEAFDDADRKMYDPEVAAPKMGSKRFRIYFVEDEDQTPA